MSDKPTHASRTGIIFGLILSRSLTHRVHPVVGRVVIKLWLGPDIDLNQNIKTSTCPEIESLRYEVLVYSRITEKIIKPGYSVNFIPFIAYGRCKREDIEKTIPLLGKDFQKLEKKYATDEGCQNPEYTNAVHMMITQAACQNGVCQRLFDLTSKPALTRFTTNFFDIQNVSSILLTLVWSLAVLQHFAKIRHNDLHLQNILLRDPDPNRPLFVYALSMDRIYVIPPSWMPRQPVIFDWDRASVYDSTFGPSNISLNAPSTNYCYLFNQCSEKEDRFDLYTLLCYMGKLPDTIGEKVVQKIIPNFIPECKEIEKNNPIVTCRTKTFPTDFPTPYQMLATGKYFDPFLLKNVLQQDNLKVYAEKIIVFPWVGINRLTVEKFVKNQILNPQPQPPTTSIRTQRGLPAGTLVGKPIGGSQK